MIKKVLGTPVMMFAVSASAASPPVTMRVDYYHAGNAAQEAFKLDRVVIEPLAWPGNPRKAIDDTNLGKHLVEVVDRATSRVLYSRGFNSIYGEWELSEEARTTNRTFHESLRFPAPAAPVQIVIKKRDPQNAFREIWSFTLDPKDTRIDTSKPRSPGPLLEIQKRGDPASKVDLLILGDGYTAAESGKFEKDARRLAEVLFATSPFKERRDDFNVWGLCPPALESGISRPSWGVQKRPPVGTAYDAFGSDRYILTFENRSFRAIASFAPYDCVVILANDKPYGGGGIFNLFAIVPADNPWAACVFVHEFGHHFADLADEYFATPGAYPSPTAGVEPWEPNATAMHDPSNLKWKDLVDASTPLPTPWNKEAFETFSQGIEKRYYQLRAERRPEQEIDALFKEEKARVTPALASEKYAGKVGAFEGAMCHPKGYFRSQLDCIMFSRNDVPFCAVCRRAIERIINLYAR